MLRIGFWKSRKRNMGSATAEFAIATPLLMMMMVGATDFARIFYHSIAVAHAAGTGAFWGGQSVVKAGKFGASETVAEDAAADLDRNPGHEAGATATSSLYCDCPLDAGGYSEIDCKEVSCSALPGGGSTYGAPRVYSEVKVEQGFETLVDWPGVPSSVGVMRQHYSRVH